MEVIDNKEIFLSIIIPAYNVEKYIRECIDSIILSVTEKEFQQIEIIVVNDGSTDTTGDILNSYDSLLKNICIIAQRNAGVAAARNRGIKAARGKYILFADSDDYFVPKSLSLIIEYLCNNSDVDVLEYDNFELVDGRLIRKSGDYIPESGNGQKVYALWDKASLPQYVVWTKVVLREMLLAYNLFFHEGIIHEDEEWVPKLFAYAQKAAYVPIPVYVYRTIREHSLMYQITERNYRDLIAVFDALVDFEKQNKFSSEYSAILNKKASSLYWGVFHGLQRHGKYDTELEHEIKERMYIIQYSTTFHRRIIYKYILKIFGIKFFYVMKYGIKNILTK